MVVKQGVVTSLPFINGRIDEENISSIGQWVRKLFHYRGVIMVNEANSYITLFMWINCTYLVNSHSPHYAPPSPSL